MDAIYNGAVGYERIKSFIGAIIVGLIGICLIICGISSLASPPSTPTNSTKTQSSTETSNNWLILSIIGIILLAISGALYFMATDTSKTTQNILAAQGAIDATSSVFSLFNNKNGGDFMIGE